MVRVLVAYSAEFAILQDEKRVLQVDASHDTLACLCEGQGKRFQLVCLYFSVPLNEAIRVDSDYRLLLECEYSDYLLVGKEWVLELLDHLSLLRNASITTHDKLMHQVLLESFESLLRES